MDEVDFKELMWFRFFCKKTFPPPIIFMVEKCVQFDIWNFFFKNFKGSSPLYDLAHFSKF